MRRSMDPHSPSPYIQHHHHNSTKYAGAHRLLPPPPPPPPFHPSPNLLRPHPPPPPLRLPPPPPPHFNTHNSQFVYDPNHPSLASRNHHTHPIVHDGDRPDFPNFHRGAAYGDVPRRRITEFGPQRQQLQQRQHYPRDSRDFFDSIWHARHEPEDRGRFLEERNPRVELNGYHSRGQFEGLGSDRSSRDNRRINLNLGNYEGRRFVHDKYHHHRDRDRDVHFDSLVEIGGSDREHYTSREANLEAERHGSKGESREVSHEFNWTPRKVVQKRSAFLRIQKPANTNSNNRIGAREDDRVQCDAKSGSLRTSSSKEQDKYLDHGKLAEQVSREGSPVQLDVSFKSNSLVAKAIVTSPTSCAGSGGKSLTVGKSNVSKHVIPGKDASDSQLSKPGQGDSRLGKSEGFLNIASSRDKDLKQSKEKVATSGNDNARDSSSLSGSIGTNVLVGNSVVQGSTKGIVSNENAKSVVSGKTPSPKTEKKKKIVKKLVKRTAAPSLRSCSQLTNNFDGPVKIHSLVLALPVFSDLDKAAGTVDSGLCQNVMTVMPKIDNVKGSVCTTVSKNGAEDCDKLAVPSIKRRRGQSTSPLGSSGHKETEFGKSLVGCVNELHVSQSTNMNVDIIENEKLSANFLSDKDHGKQLCQNEDTYLVESSSMDHSSKFVLSAEGNTSFVSSSSEKIEVQDCPVNSCKEKMKPESPLVDLDDGTTVSGLDVTSRLLYTNQGGPSVENGMADLFPNVCSTLLSVGFLCQSSFGENKAQNVVKCMQPSDQGSGPFFSTEVACNSAGMNFSSSRSSDDDNDKQLSTLGLTMSVENDSMRAPRHSEVSKEESEKNASGVEQNDKSSELNQLDLSRLKMSKDGSEKDGLSEQNVDGIKLLQLDLSSSEVLDSCLMAVNRPSSAQWVDTALRLSLKERCPVEFTDSGNLSVEASLQHSPERTDVIYKSSSMDVSESNVGPCGASLRDNRKRKSSVLNLEFCSPTTSDRDEGNVIAGISRADAEVSSCSGDGQLQDSEEVIVSGTDPPCMSTADLESLNEDITSLVGRCLQGEYVDNICSREKSSEVDTFTGVQSCSTHELLTAPKSWSSEWGAEEIVNANLLPNGDSHQQEPMDIDTNEGTRKNADAEEQDTTDSRVAKCRIPPELQLLDFNGRLPGTDIENDSDQGLKHNFPSMSTATTLLVDCSEVSAVNCSDGVMELVPDPLSIMGSPETLPVDPGMLCQVVTQQHSGNDDKVLVENPSSKGTSNASTHGSLSHDAKVVSMSDPSVKAQPLFAGKLETLHIQGFKTTAQTQNAVNGELYGRKNQCTTAVSRTYPSHVPLAFTPSRTKVSSAHITKPRTWHRNNNGNSSGAAGKKANLISDVTQSQSQNKFTKLQNTSYVRKRNSLSLVRNPVPIAGQPQISSGLSSSVYQSNVSGTGEAKKNVGYDSRNATAGMENSLRIGINASFERPRTPPLPNVPKMSNHAINSSEDHISSPITEPLQYDSTETTLSSAHLSEINDAPKSTEDVQEIPAMSIIKTEPNNRLECHGEQNNGNLVFSNVRSLRYVKTASNQLVATPNPCSSSIHNTHNSSSSDGYYKKKKNQIVRASVDSQVRQICGMPNESSHLERQPAANITSSRSISKKQLRKEHAASFSVRERYGTSEVLTKTCKSSKFSLVWTLHGALRNNGVPLNCSKVLPHLVPWKRATYRRSFLPTLASNSDNRSLSAIGRKLLLLRKRDTVYTRSKHGFSLRKSKVLSVGASSLKWSKSIERHSKKANEEATIAVAAAERKKREQTGAASLVGGSKLRNSSARERIFRIGSARYKMDSSRSTLHRISDDESLGSAVTQIQKNSQRSYVPWRLVIGKDEYVRIGNGNQLIRDPKKRTRILASEKVRWSLHTARSRLARKRKYCQFYTRFGKCNKDDGKCPYIHDSSKIAVCTKFLNGLCSNTDCKLTHEVIPERMPDCSYFIQGLCTNKDCSYRHVHVHPNASTCEGFLRGYCADGNECRKKHSNICPVYEATGSCPQGSKCKLHHPKNRTKGRKRKRSRDNKNARGRYFAPMRVNVSDPTTSVFEKRPIPDKEEDVSNDYISLDIGDEETGILFDRVDEETSFSDGDSMDLKSDDLDELIRPILIMQT